MRPLNYKFCTTQMGHVRDMNLLYYGNVSLNLENLS